MALRRPIFNRSPSLIGAASNQSAASPTASNDHLHAVGIHRGDALLLHVDEAGAQFRPAPVRRKYA